MKPRTLVLGLAFVLLASSFGFFPRATAQDETGALGGDLIVALQTFGGLDPTSATAAADRKVLELVYDSLGRIDPVTLQFVPWAATGWEHDGNKNITVTLRNDLRFDNGAAYDADAVVQSLNTYEKNGDQRWNVIKVNELTVRFDFAQINQTNWNYKTDNEAGPGLFFTEGLSAFIAWDDTATRRYSGPFRVSSETPGSELKLAPNVYHFSGRPYLDSITYKYPYRLDINPNNPLDPDDDTTYPNDAGCALMFGEVHLIGWNLQTNDLSNLRDCDTPFGGFTGVTLNQYFDLPNTDGSSADDWTFAGWAGFTPQNATGHKHLTGGNPGHHFSIHMRCDRNTPTGGYIQQPWPVTVSNAEGTLNLQYKVGAWGTTAVSMTIYAFVDAQAGSPDPEQDAWNTTIPFGTGNTSWVSVSVDVKSKIRTADTYYVKIAGVTTNADVPCGTETQLLLDNTNASWDGKLSLLSTDPDPHVSHILAAKNPGTDLLYFGFSYRPGSLFIGGPGSQGQMLRSSIYQFVNKGLYRLVEPNTGTTHGLQSKFNTPWAPTSCSPWTPCDTIVEAATVRAPAPVNQRTDTDPGIQALNNAGIFDRDGNGFRQMSTGQQVTISILKPAYSLDPRKSNMADDMQFLLASAGLDVSVVPYDSWAALDSAIGSCTTSCFYVRRYTAATQLPDWVYDMPEVRASGDTLADLHLNLGARSSFTLTDRTLHVGHVSHLVGAAADFLPVSHFDQLETVDFRTFAGWVNTFGGINNVWSMTNLRLPALGSLHARVSVFPVGLRPGGVGAVQVEVRDSDGVLVPDVHLDLSAGAHTSALEDVVGMTDSEGTFRTNYTAPAVEGDEDHTIWVTATKVQYTGVRASSNVAVHPAHANALVVTVNRGPNFVIDPTATATITVHVEDANDNPIQNARVVLRTDLPGGTFADADGTTNAQGNFETVFTPEVGQGMTFQIIAEVSAENYDSVMRTASLQVSSNPGEVPVTQTVRNVPGFEVAGAIGAIALTFALVALARRRRED